jgi:hypothetical protein
MNCPVTITAKSDQVVLGILALMAPESQVMNFDCGERAAGLASPAVSLQDLLAQYLVGVRIQPNPGTFF